jgi:non-specific serine/threonine protein kinase
MMLELAVSPDRILQPEWVKAQSRIDKGQQSIQQEFFSRFSEQPAKGLLYLGFCDRQIPLSDSLSFWRMFCGAFAEKLRLTPELETLRHRVDPLPDAARLAEILEAAPPCSGSEYIDPPFLERLWSELAETYRSMIRAYHGSVGQLLSELSPNIHLIGRVYFHLVENKGGPEPFAFLATYSTSLNSKGQSRHMPLKHALQEYGKDSATLLELLSTVRLASADSGLVAGLLESGELFQPIGLTAKEAYEFLTEIPVYEKAGILCRIPDWWRGGASSLKVRITAGNKQPSRVGLNALVDFTPSLALDGETISEQEARKLLAASEGLAFIKNKWVAVDHEKLRFALEVYKKSRKLIESGSFTLKDAFRLELDQGRISKGEEVGEVLEVTNGAWLDSVIKKLRAPEAVGAALPGAEFKAELRPYQKSGVGWLWLHHRLGFGACLADDMGLGKTIQALALICLMKESGVEGESLLIIPASLLGNWQDEITRFAPSLRVKLAHPVSGLKEGLDAVSADETDLVITTYALVQRYAWLREREWNYIILDEAQAIKNPSSLQTRAVKTLRCRNRLIMTGTPVENRLSDLWSLFDFLNPGLLGTSAEFSGFLKKQGQGSGGYSRLRRLVAPYILRRMKTDKLIISDLPEKVEMKTYTSLTKKQAVLYEELVGRLRDSVKDAEGISRKGIILSYLVKCKQLCNHPDQYLGAGAFSAAESGKFRRLGEICETIRDKREKVLVFTQFREMTEPLSDYLAGLFGRKGFVLHGGTPVGRRRELIAGFQGGESYVPFMVLSLKAGGVGLNLTSANHVIHFDRWWNPAVENQATDRAFRIGQKRNVLVHKFITKGTIEERIDKLIEDKIRLSDEALSAGGEALITEMDDSRLMELFRLAL